MKILALDTSERQFSAAALSGDSVLAELVCDYSSNAANAFQGAQHFNRSEQPEYSQRSHLLAPVATPSSGVAVDLFPMLKRLLVQVGWEVSDIEQLAVAKGPGSFTGLRTGIVAAKTIAFARNITVQGANTLEAMAAQLGWYLQSENKQNAGPSKEQLKGLSVHCVINAQRQQLFAAKYRLVFDPAGQFQVKVESTSRILNRDAWIARLAHGDWVTGTGLKPLLESLQGLPIKIAPRTLWLSMASSIGRIAFRDFLAGSRDDFWTLEPLYFRPSYADENKAD